jgi:hypothetical protein
MTQSRFRLTANPDSKAGGQQQTTTHPGGQQHEERSAWRTSVNDSKQPLPSPPFGPVCSAAESTTKQPIPQYRHQHYPLIRVFQSFIISRCIEGRICRYLPIVVLIWLFPSNACTNVSERLYRTGFSPEHAIERKRAWVNTYTPSHTYRLVSS